MDKIAQLTDSLVELEKTIQELRQENKDRPLNWTTIALYHANAMKKETLKQLQKARNAPKH